MRSLRGALPWDRNPPGSVGATLAGQGLIDDFELYTALREKRRHDIPGAQNFAVSWPFNVSTTDASTAPPLSNSRLMMVPQIVRAGQAIDGVMYVQQVAGAYTAVNTNGVAAYTCDGVNFTRVAQGTNANLWKSAAGLVAQPFGAQLAAFGQDTIVWACGLWNQSALVTTPVIAGMTVSGGGIGANSPGLGVYSFQVDNPGQVNFPASFGIGAVVAGDTNHEWLAFYRNYA